VSLVRFFDIHCHTLIKDETVHSNLVISSGPFESPRADYDFMIVSTEPSSSESSKFLAMIQHVISSTFSFTGCLEFIPESNLLLAHLICVISGIPYISFFHR